MAINHSLFTTTVKFDVVVHVQHDGGCVPPVFYSVGALVQAAIDCSILHAPTSAQDGLDPLHLALVVFPDII